MSTTTVRQANYMIQVSGKILAEAEAHSDKLIRNLASEQDKEHALFAVEFARENFNNWRDIAHACYETERNVKLEEEVADLQGINYAQHEVEQKQAKYIIELEAEIARLNFLLTQVARNLG